jgi:hypothetical protein
MVETPTKSIKFNHNVQMFMNSPHRVPVAVKCQPFRFQTRVFRLYLQTLILNPYIMVPGPGFMINYEHLLLSDLSLIVKWNNKRSQARGCFRLN